MIGRGRPEHRARVVLASFLVAGGALSVLLWPSADLHAPVIEVIHNEVPEGPPMENLTTLLATTTVLNVPLFEPVDAALAGLDPRGLERAVDAVRREVRRGVLPGASIVVGRGEHVVEKRGIGVLAPELADVDPDGTMYDLASLTKVVATTSAVMLLVEDGKMEMDAPVSRYLPEFTGGARSRVTVRQLLTHTSGLPAGASPPSGNPEATLARLIATPLRNAPGEKVVYSDIGPIVLFAAAERVAGEPIPALLERRVFTPLGMKSTRFDPGTGCSRCAPTTSRFRGTVHDPLAQRLGGVAGNAGLFSTATDMGRFAAMLAGGGALGGVRIFREETVRTFTARQPGAQDRALGWELPGEKRTDGSGGARISDRAFGHTGFTGTSIWMDPQYDVFVILLSNRVNPTRNNQKIGRVRTQLADAVLSVVRGTR